MLMRENTAKVNYVALIKGSGGRPYTAPSTKKAWIQTF